MSAECCAGLVGCVDFQQSYATGRDTCRKCDGDITKHRLVTGIIDSHLAPIIDEARHTEATNTAESWIDAAGEIRSELETHDHYESAGDVGLLMTVRLLQRVAALEARLRITMRAV